MANRESSTQGAIALEVFRFALKTQYHAALAMLRQAIEKCPDERWAEADDENQFWHIAYHTLYYTHLYLQPRAEDFSPWVHHQTFIQDLDEYRAPPEIQALCEWSHRPPQTGKPYTREQVLEYWGHCDEMVDGGIDAPGPARCGVWLQLVRPHQGRASNGVHSTHPASHRTAWGKTARGGGWSVSTGWERDAPAVGSRSFTFGNLRRPQATGTWVFEWCR